MIQSPDKKVWLPDGDTWDKWHGDWELEEYNEVMQHISEKNVAIDIGAHVGLCLLYTSPSPRDATLSRMPSSA